MTRIKAIEVIPVSVPRIRPLVISAGKTENSNRVIVKTYGDNGLIGLGEATPSPIFSSESLESVLTATRNYLSPQIIGEDFFNIERILKKMDKVLVGNQIAKAAIEISLWDLMGRFLDLPLHSLLGGLCRGKIPVSYILGIGKPREMALEAREAVKNGYSSLKIKIGIDPKRDLENVATVREAVGNDLSLRVDANGGYRVDVAMKVLRKMEDYDLELIEQPVAGWDLSGMSKIRKSLDTPIMADESVFSPSDAMNVIREEAADIINIKVMKVGGLYKAKKIAAIAESAGISCLVGSMIELGIGTAASAHFASSTPNLSYSSELVGTTFTKDHILKEAYVPTEGHLEIPKGYGLGVEIDEDKVAKYRC